MYLNFYCFIDINECATDAHNCDIKAICTNTSGSYACACVSGSGNGTFCECNVGFFGIGKTCPGMQWN